MNLTPEQKIRIDLSAALEAAGHLLLSYSKPVSCLASIGPKRSTKGAGPSRSVPG